MTSDDSRKALLKLQALCARKEYCTSEMRGKALKLTEGDTDAAEELVAALVSDRFVDDLRYASAFARDKAHLDGWGPVKIRYQLGAKGISPSVIAEALSEIEEEKAESRLSEILASKYRTLKDDPDVRLKLLKFALTRGYEYPAADRTVRELTGK